MVLEALRDLVHVRIMSVGDAPPIKRRDYLTDSSLEPTLSKPFLEALILTGHPIARRAWYSKDYFDRLLALKHLTIRSGLKMQSGNSKVSSDSFSHIAPLRSFTWHGYHLTSSHRKAFTTRHGGTLRFLNFIVSTKYLDDGAAQ